MKRFVTIATLFLLMILGATSCDKYVFDDLNGCDRGVRLNLYSKTECATQRTYPSVQKWTFFAFDEEGLYVSTHQEKDLKLDENLRYVYPVDSAGQYSIVAWGGDIDKSFSIKTPQKGITKKSDLLLQLRLEANRAINLNNEHIYIGETPMVTIGSQERFFVDADINIREITNRITVEVKGLDDPKDVEIELSANNAAYAYNGSVAPWQKIVYPTQQTFPKDSVTVAAYTTMKLESGRNSSLVIRSKKDQKEIFNEDLVGTILLSPSSDNINLRCLNDFTIVLKTRRCNCPGGFVITELWINDWLIHSYDIAF